MSDTEDAAPKLHTIEHIETQFRYSFTQGERWVIYKPPGNPEPCLLVIHPERRPVLVHLDGSRIILDFK